MRTTARVVVIGGGAMGCSLLYHLTKLGWDDVVLLEKNELTAGSTWHAAGLFTHFAHNLTIMQLRADSAKLYGSLEAETGQPVGFHQCGALRVTKLEDRLEEFRHVQGLGRYAGFDFHIVSPEEIKALHPLVVTEDLLGGIYEPLDGHVDPSQATQAMAAGARTGGAAVYRHNPVTAIEQKANGEWLVRSRDGDITCEMVVNAAGTWCREIGAMMGLDLPVVPMLHQYLVIDRVAAVAARDRELPMIRDPEESWYVRQERDGLIAGPYERDGRPWSVDGLPPDFGMELLPPDLDQVEHIAAAAMARVPALAEAGIKTIVHGPITFTPDANPLIGPAHGLDNAWLLTGSSMGVMEGGGAGKLLAEWMVGGEAPMDVLALDSRRFGAYADRDYRLAKAVESFGHQFAIHYPYEERPAGRPKKTTPIQDALAEAGAVFGAAYGWERPNWFARRGTRAESSLSFRRTNWFAAVGDECRALRDRVALADLSAFSKFAVSGAGAPAFMAALGANRPPADIGRVGLTHSLTPKGGVLSEFTVTRLGEARYYLVSAAAAERQDHDLLRALATEYPRVEIDNVTASRGVLAVMGPESRGLLSKLTDADLENPAFPWLSAREISVAGVPVIALRLSYVGELGWELHHPLDRQAELYSALCGAGQSQELGHFGAFAMNASRLEKGYRAWGLDLSSERTPLESGLGDFVKRDGRPYQGRAALATPAQMNMALLEIGGEGPDPFTGHPLLLAGRVAGLVTSGAYGHRVGKKLALAYLEAGIARSDPGPLAVEIIGEACPATILTDCPYDPGNNRLRG